MIKDKGLYGSHLSETHRGREKGKRRLTCRLRRSRVSQELGTVGVKIQPGAMGRHEVSELL